MLWTHIENAHVLDEEQKLVEANVLVSLLLALLSPGTTPGFDVPDSNRTFLQLRPDPGFLIDGFEESCLPPLYLGPDVMGGNEFLEFYFSAIFKEVVGEGEHHEHLGVVGIEFDITDLKEDVNAGYDPVLSRIAELKKTVDSVLLEA